MLWIEALAGAGFRPSRPSNQSSTENTGRGKLKTLDAMHLVHSNGRVAMYARFICGVVPSVLLLHSNRSRDLSPEYN